MTRPSRTAARAVPPACPPAGPAAGLAAWLVVAGLAAGPAAAGNWTLGGTLSERLEADSNLRLEQGGGALWGTTTSLGFDLGYDTQRTQWRLGSGLSVAAFAGPGDSEGLNGLADPRLTAAVVHHGKDQTLGADFGFLRRSTSFTRREAADLGPVDRKATESVASLDGFWTRELDADDRVTLSVDSTVRRFSGDEGQLTPSTGYGLTGRWQRLLDPRTDAGLSLGVRRFEQDGASTSTDSTVLRLGAELDRRLTPRHRLSLDLGISRSASEETTDFGPFTVTDSSYSLGVSGDAAFDWRGTGGTTLRLSASQALDPSAETGTLDQTSRLGAALTRPLTPRSTASLVVDAARRVGQDQADDQPVYFLSVGPRLDLDLTRDWSARLGADLRYREDQDGTITAAGVFLELSRAFVLNR